MRRPGIEPGSQEWESCMIPLHQRRLATSYEEQKLYSANRHKDGSKGEKWLPPVRFELTTPGLRDQCSTTELKRLTMAQELLTLAIIDCTSVGNCKKREKKAFFTHASRED